MSGSAFTTKGLVSGGGAGAETEISPSLPPGFGTAPGTPLLKQDAHVVVAVPTAINTCLMAAENITDNLRAQQTSDLALPSLYKRAYLVANVTDEVAIVRQ